MKKVDALKGIFVLGMSVCLLSACSSTPAGQSNNSKVSQTSEGEKAGEQENGTGELMWQDKEGNWQFDTSKFDASKFSGKLYIDGKEISLPMTVDSLLEQEIYVHRATDETLESTLTEMQEREIKSGDFENSGWVWHNEDGTIESISGIKQRTIWNPLQENIPIKECAVGTMMFKPDKDGVPIMGFEVPEVSPYRLSLEEVVDMLGVPCYSTGSTIYYYYGDYSLSFYCHSSGEISSCTYITTAYGESPLYKNGGGWAEYKAVYDKLNP
ncbi:MAG: hypothetical protein NC094_05300 [Bacteroidales bacterium]|nr:hypothetical protein [Lachnoclostridium sp.]MCM1384152.1 hypothetical protein [Lachnoclostridium sp.]MCM1464818.1 hypothetical protein [Bacteroidales bacterium]